MRAFHLIALAALALAACAPPQAATPTAGAGAALPEGRWITADGAGETALVFVPNDGGREVALICALGATPAFRVETADAAFAAAPDAAAASILIGDVAIEGALSRMATETGDLVQMSTPITQTLLTQIRAAGSFRLNAGSAHVLTGAAPEPEKQAFASACASLAGLTAP